MCNTQFQLKHGYLKICLMEIIFSAFSIIHIHTHTTHIHTIYTHTHTLANTHILTHTIANTHTHTHTNTKRVSIYRLYKNTYKDVISIKNNLKSSISKNLYSSYRY